MRKYYITEWDLGYHVFRIDPETEIKEWLQNDTYTPHKEYARTFYHLDSAISNLTIAKAKCLKGKETSTTSIKKSESEEHKEKTSWSEF